MPPGTSIPHRRGRSTAAGEAAANPLLAAPLKCAARGWRVFPAYEWDDTAKRCACGDPKCKRAGKHPRTEHGLKDGTRDEKLIRLWWGRWPTANVAVVCGPDSGVWMVGPDGDRGIADLAALEARHGPLPAGVPRSATQGGGEHLFFAWPADGKPITNRKNWKGTKIDVRACGGGPGYVILPPSVGPQGSYRWIDPPAGPLPAAPDWLVEWARTAEPRPSPPPNAPRPGPGGRRSDAVTRAAGYLATCPPSISGQRGHDALLWAARVLVRGFRLSDGEAMSLLTSDFNPRCRPEWSERELLHKVGEAREKPFDKPWGWLLDADDPARESPPPAASGKPHANGPPPGATSAGGDGTRHQGAAGGGTPPGAAGAKRPPVLDTGISLADLMATDFPPPRYVVDELIPEGLTVLAGRPKDGKSWLAYQVAIGAALGVPCLGKLHTKSDGRDVLGLFMEDTRKRLKDRGKKILAGRGWAATRRVDLRVAWPRSGAGGLAQVAEWLSEHPGGLVIVDTLARFRDLTKGNVNNYEQDYEAVTGLKSLADQYEGAVLILHHTRKSPANSPFDEVTGTLGINAAADSILVLERTRTDAGGTLYGTGRDLPERTVAMSWDAAHGLWTVCAAVDGIERAESDKGVTKPGQCAAWLRDFLRGFAWPDAELVAAARAAGFTEDNLKKAKTALRKADPRLRAAAVYAGGPWWNWIGDHRPSNRPADMAVPLNTPPETPETPETGPPL